MVRRIIKRLMWLISSPIISAVRNELDKRLLGGSKNIEMELQRRALESTADYVEKHMKNIDSVASNFELIQMAMNMADFSKKGMICEFGVFSGSTINYIASKTNLPVYGFDSFQGLPERWRDGYGEGHFKLTDLPKVPANVELIKGWFNQTLPVFIKDHDGAIAFLHIDCDLYSSTTTILDSLKQRIHPGCVIVFDEYFNYPGWEEGEYKAFQEFVRQTGLEYEYIGYNRFHEQVAVKIKKQSV